MTVYTNKEHLIGYIQILQNLIIKFILFTLAIMIKRYNLTMQHIYDHKSCQVILLPIFASLIF